MEAAPTRQFVGRRGLDAFHDAISSTLVDQRLEPSTSDGFIARLDAVELGGAGLVESWVSPLRARRDSAGDADGSLFLLTTTTADGRIEHRRGSDPVLPGRIIVIPGGETFDVQYRSAAHVSFVVIPAAMVRRRFADLDGPIRSIALRPLGAALIAQLATLKKSARSLESGSIDGRVIDRLVAPVLDALVDEVRPTGHRTGVGIQAAAERTIERSLGHPALDASFIARRLGVSLRTLHRAFEQADTTVAARIRDRRLDAAASRLTREPGVRVADVAADLGFGSASRFAGLFRERFGCTPSVYGTFRPPSSE